jgi:type VI secretion system protein ImpC
MGLLSLVHEKDADHAMFAMAQSIQETARGGSTEVAGDAIVTAQLPYFMVVSRFAHYLMLISRDKCGSFVELEQCQDWLNRWISQYVHASASPSPEITARYPLQQASVEVREVEGKRGRKEIEALLLPWLLDATLLRPQEVTLRVPSQLR